MHRDSLLAAIGLGALALIACKPASARSDAPHASAVSAAQVEQLKAGIAPLVDRSPDTREVIQGPKGYEIRVRSGNRQVMVARRNADGTISTACVDSVKGAEKAVTSPGTTRLEDR